jgi:hypothetical protein
MATRSPRCRQNNSPPRREICRANNSRLSRRAAQNGMSEQWAEPVTGSSAQIDLDDRREPTQMIVISLQSEERGFREIILCRNLLKNFIRQPFLQYTNAGRIAAECSRSEGVNLIIWNPHASGWKVRWRQPSTWHASILVLARRDWRPNSFPIMKITNLSTNHHASVADPDVDVWLTAKANTSGCFAVTRFKAGRLINP